MSKILKHPFLNPEGRSYSSFDFSRHDLKGPGANKRLNAFKQNMTAREFIRLVAGDYGHSGYHLKDIAEHVKRHPHHTEKNIDIAIRHAAKQGRDRTSSGDNHIKSILEHFHASPQMLDRMIEVPEEYGLHSVNKKGQSINTMASDLSNQKNLSSDHIRKILKHDARFQIDKDLLINPNFKPEMYKEAIDSEHARFTPSAAELIADQHAKHGFLGEDGDRQLFKIFQKGNYSVNTIDSILDTMTPENRTKTLDALLGITGGSHTEEEYANDPDSNWNNWEPGEHHRPSLEAELASSKHLNPAQAEHLMRHSEIDTKWNLFHNKHLGSNFADQMYAKWLDDDHRHGYDLNEFKEKIKDENEYEYEDWYDDAREKAQEDYTLEDYIKDNYDDKDLVGKPEDEWIEDYLNDQYDWTHKDDSQPKLTDEDGETIEPEEEDYSRNKEDHPEYNDRFDEAQAAWDKAVEDAKRNPDDSIWESYDDSLSESISEKARDLYDEEMEDAHENEKYLPDHLSALQEIRRKQSENKERLAFKEAQDKEKQVADKIDPYLPNRFHEHAYGEGQHHIELAKDYADANNGTIDVGHLNKLHPNMVDKWKKIFNGKGKLSSQELQQKIDELPKRKYNLSYGHWGANNAQNLNDQDEVVIRLDHSPETLAEIKKDPEAYEVFQKINEAAQRSGHPTNFNSIAWVRADFNDPKHPMIDELQSDFGSAARDYLAEHGGEKGSEKAKHLDKILEIQKGWRETLLNAVTKLAKKHGADQISTHSPESKAAHTGASKVHSVYKDSYEKIPRQMGFKPSSMDKLPLSDAGKSVFTTKKSGKDLASLLSDHLEGLGTHGFLANAHTQLASEPVQAEGGPSDLRDIHSGMAEEHQKKFKEHLNRIKQLDPTHEAAKFRTFSDYSKWHLKGLEGGEEEKNIYEMNKQDALKFATANKQGSLSGIPVFGFDAALKQQPKVESGHQGHTLPLNLAAFKKHIIVADLLMKSQSSNEKMAVAQVLANIQQQQDSINELQQTNPEAYNAITELVSILVDLFKEINDEPIEAAMHEMQVQQQIGEAGQPMQPVQEDSIVYTPEGSVPPPRQADPLTHGKKVYPTGAIREYDSKNARQKGPDGQWVSVSGGMKRDDFQ